jgi:hypothetical protein
MAGSEVVNSAAYLGGDGAEVERRGPDRGRGGTGKVKQIITSNPIAL